MAAVALSNDATQAEALGYGNRHNSSKDKFVNNDHSTNLLYVNDGQSRAISPDASSHSGGRVGWKAFVKQGGQGWKFKGEYDVNLDPWEHRKRSAKNDPFPRG